MRLACLAIFAAASAAPINSWVAEADAGASDLYHCTGLLATDRGAQAGANAQASADFWKDATFQVQWEKAPEQPRFSKEQLQKMGDGFQKMDAAFSGMRDLATEHKGFLQKEQS